MDEISWYALIAVALHWSAVVGFSIRVVMRRRPVGVLLAWIAIILSVPVVGILLYLFIGENRVSAKYLRRSEAIHTQYVRWKQSLSRHYPVDFSRLSREAAPLQQQARSLFGFPVTPGNRVELLTDYESAFRALIRDIRDCRSSCHFEFYIWHAGGLVDEVQAALVDAARRGVSCRVLLDALGSKPFLGSAAIAQFREAGIELGVSLPVGPLTALVSRADLRNHRKVVVIDGEIAYTGSQNLADPRVFKQNEGVGQWIDAMVRIEGPAVEAFAGNFIQDWEVVTGVGFEYFEGTSDLKQLDARGSALVQLVPSGPRPKPLAILQLVLGTIYSARRELIITTPYFVPDESVLTALVSAAHRGVEVTVIIPEKNDSRLVDYASRAVFDDLLSEGVRIAAFRSGMLHTKSISVDGEYCMFGSLNLDMRSLWLNFEMSVYLYDRELVAQIRDMQIGYLRDCELIDPAAVRQRPLTQRFAENVVHLLAPLL
ncbi:MAG: cardiolipin synthase [Thiogranum sp.]